MVWFQFLNSTVNEEDALERMRRIEAARLRQQAAVDAAAAKYLEEKRLVCQLGLWKVQPLVPGLLNFVNHLLQKEEKAAKEKAEEWERLQKGLGYHNKTKKPVWYNTFLQLFFNIRR